MKQQQNLIVSMNSNEERETMMMIKIDDFYNSFDFPFRIF